MNKKQILTALIMTAVTPMVMASSVSSTDIITTNGTNSFSVGYSNTVLGENSQAIGTAVYTKSDDSIGIGHGVINNLNNSIGIGNGVVTNLSNSIGIGNGVATNFNTVGIGNGVATNVQDSVAIGNGVTTDGISSVAIGNGISASGDKTVNIGTNVSAKGVSSVVIGRDTAVEGDDTTVVGANNGTVSAGQSAIVGYNNKVGAYKEQLILGSNSETKAQGALVFGTHSKAVADDAVAIGNNTVADQANSVALGTNSTTDSVVSTDHIYINGVKHDFAGGVADSTISVGATNKAGAGGVANYKRTITNVAAGRIDDNSTDAVNGSQLNAVINSLNFTTVAEGKNTTVAETTNIDGGKEFSVSVNKDLYDMGSTNFGKVSDPTHSVVNADKAHFFNNEETTSVTAQGMKLENTDNLDTAEYTMNGMHASSNGKDVAFGTDGVSVGNQQINNVAKGTKDTDAVNVAQLKEVNNAVTTLSDDVGKALDAQQQFNDAVHTTLANHKDAINGVKQNVATNTSNINTLKQGVATNTADIRAIENTVGDHEGRITTLENRSFDLSKDLNNKISNLDGRLNKVGARASALSALHPLDFNPNSKLEFAVGYGNYKGSNAVALGAFYRPNENLMFSVGSTLGSENMFNAGATIRFGKASQMTNDRIKSLDNEVAYLNVKYAQLEDRYNELMKTLEEKNK